MQDRSRFSMPLWIALAAVPCVAGCRTGAEFERDAIVRAASSASPVRPGTHCRVGIRNEWRGGYPCRVSLVCDGVTLYGGARLGGWAECSARDGRWVSAVDSMESQRDGDPWMNFDVARGEIEVREANGLDVVVSVSAPGLVATR